MRRRRRRLPLFLPALLAGFAAGLAGAPLLPDFGPPSPAGLEEGGTARASLREELGLEAPPQGGLPNPSEERLRMIRLLEKIEGNTRIIAQILSDPRFRKGG